MNLVENKEGDREEFNQTTVGVHHGIVAFFTTSCATPSLFVYYVNDLSKLDQYAWHKQLINDSWRIHLL